MNSKQRLLKALNREVPDRLPVTTHHVMPSFMDHYMDGAGNQEFFARFGLDPIHWTMAYAPDAGQGEYYDQDQF